MASLTIRDLPDSAKENLRVSAAKSGVSLEAYARHILQEASRSRFGEPLKLVKLAEDHFGDKSGVELKLPSRQSARSVVEFD